jgi:magnesium chelatase family protein
MAGSPGSGKALLARALPGILPKMSIEESLDTAVIVLFLIPFIFIPSF